MAIGSRILRSEDRPLLTGSARFVDDIHLDGALEAAFLRSPIAHGRLLDPGVDAVSRAPGVEAVFAAADLGLGPLQPPNENPAVSPPPQPALASEKVCFAGEPIAIVVARDRYAAEDARDVAIPEIEELEALVDPRRALAEGAPQIHEGRDNLVVDVNLDEGDVEGALAAADVVVERTLRTPRLSALPIEGRAVAGPAGGLGRPDLDLLAAPAQGAPAPVRDPRARPVGGAGDHPRRRWGLRSQGPRVSGGGRAGRGRHAARQTGQVGRGPVRESRRLHPGPQAGAGDPRRDELRR